MLKIKIIAVLENIHDRLFGHVMSSEMKRFLSNLSISFIGGSSATGIMFIINMLSARVLGPNEFGMFNSVLSLTTAFSYIFIMGSDSAAVRYISEENRTIIKNNFLSASLLLALFSTFLFIFLATIVFPFQLFGKKVFIYAMVLALFLSYKNLTDAYLRSFQLFGKQSLIKVIEALIVLATIGVSFFVLKKTSYNYYIYSLILGMLFSIMTVLFLIRRKFSTFKIKHLLILFHYQKYLAIAVFGSVIISLEKYCIGKYIGIEQLGLYSVYYAISFLILSTFSSIFMNVFWPAVITNKRNMEHIVSKLLVLSFKCFIFWVLIDSLFSYLMFRLIGASYHFNILFAILFAVASYMALLFSVYINLLNIDHIKLATMLIIITFGTLVLSIIVIQNLLFYLFFQIFIYLIALITSALLLKRITIT